MSERPNRQIYRALALSAAVVLVAAIALWWLAGERLPGPGSATYREMVSAFYTGVIALDVDTKDRATALLDALEAKSVKPEWLSKDHRDGLLQHTDESVRTRAAKVLR